MQLNFSRDISAELMQMQFKIQLLAKTSAITAETSAKNTADGLQNTAIGTNASSNNSRNYS
jgi:hypothetical protein